MAVHVQFVKESLLFIGEDPPMGNLLLSVTGAFAQFERQLICERQREGVAGGRRLRAQSRNGHAQPRRPVVKGGLLGRKCEGGMNMFVAHRVGG